MGLKMNDYALEIEKDHSYSTAENKSTKPICCEVFFELLRGMTEFATVHKGTATLRNISKLVHKGNYDKVSRPLR